MKKRGMFVIREALTPVAYYTDESTGLLIRADEPVIGKRLSRGRIDLICVDSKDMKERLAIEVKYPSGKNQEKYYRTGIRRDVQKLNELDDVGDRYLLCLVQDEFVRQFERELGLCKDEGLTKCIRVECESY